MHKKLQIYQKKIQLSIYKRNLLNLESTVLPKLLQNLPKAFSYHKEFMALLQKIIKSGSDWFKSIRSDNRKQLLELEKLEKKLEAQKKQDKTLMVPFVFTNRMFVKFRGF